MYKLCDGRIKQKHLFFPSRAHKHQYELPRGTYQGLFSFGNCSKPFHRANSMLFIRLLNVTISIIHSASILVTICTTMVGLFRVLGCWVVPLANIRSSFCIPSKSKPNLIGIQQAILYHRPHTNHLIYFIKGTHLSTNNIIRCTREILKKYTKITFYSLRQRCNCMYILNIHDLT